LQEFGFRSWPFPPVYNGNCFVLLQRKMVISSRPWHHGYPHFFLPLLLPEEGFKLPLRPFPSVLLDAFLWGLFPWPPLHPHSSPIVSSGYGVRLLFGFSSLFFFLPLFFCFFVDSCPRPKPCGPRRGVFPRLEWLPCFWPRTPPPGSFFGAGLS